MKILIVDDHNDKIAKIVSVIQNISSNFIIETAIDIYNAKVNLLDKQFDLLILDLQIPIRLGESPSSEGGYILAEEIERNVTLKAPKYIVGLTQYREIVNNFSSIWKVIIYDPSSNVWKEQLSNLINYIKRISFENGALPVKETVFLEGLSDLKIFKEAIKLYKPELLDKISLKSDNNAGASWVSRQVIIWAKSLHKRLGKPIKSIGILDGDNAGKDAKEEIDRIIKVNSAESMTFNIITLNPSYARNLIPLLKKGIKVSATLEEMYSLEIWKYAKTMDWLEYRIFEEDPNGWDKYNETITSHCSKLGLAEDELLYLHSVKMINKEKIVNYILNLDDTGKREALKNFENLIIDIEGKLFN